MFDNWNSGIQQINDLCSSNWTKEEYQLVYKIYCVRINRKSSIKADIIIDVQKTIDLFVDQILKFTSNHILGQQGYETLDKIADSANILVIVNKNGLQ